MPKSSKKYDASPKDTQLQMRVSLDWIREIDDWRKQHDIIPSRADAVRQLLAIGMKVERERLARANKKSPHTKDD